MPSSLLALSILFLITPSNSPEGSSKNVVPVKVTISDVAGTAIPGAEVRFAGRKVQIAKETTKKGRYLAELHPGEFELSVIADGFCNYHQMLSITPPNHEIILNINLLDCSDCPPTIVDYSDPLIPLDGTAPEFPKPVKLTLKYEEQKLENLEGSLMSPVVRFGNRVKGGDFSVYEGPNCVLRIKPAVLILRTGTLQADRLTYWIENKQLEAEGNVVLVDDKGITLGKRAKVDLSVEPPRAKVESSKEH